LKRTCGTSAVHDGPCDGPCEVDGLPCSGVGVSCTLKTLLMFEVVGLPCSGVSVSCALKNLLMLALVVCRSHCGGCCTCRFAADDFGRDCRGCGRCSARSSSRSDGPTISPIPSKSSSVGGGAGGNSSSQPSSSLSVFSTSSAALLRRALCDLLSANRFSFALAV